MDVTVDGEAKRFTAPYDLQLYCHETEVQIAHPSCTDIYRLSGCSGPDGGGVSCLYVAVDLTQGPLIGDYFDSTGQTWDLQAASMEVGGAVGRSLDGTFRATFVNPSNGAVLSTSGTFHACATRMPACHH